MVVRTSSSPSAAAEPGHRTAPAHPSASPQGAGPRTAPGHPEAPRQGTGPAPRHPEAPRRNAAPDPAPRHPEAPRHRTAPGTALELLRAAAPLTQCITNAVVTNFTANALLALGAAPAMCDIPGEAGMFAGIAGGVLVNLGTPTAEQRDAAREAVRAATPWVLDPVAVGALPVRTALAHELLDARPSIIRGNASEILALAGAGAGGRGVDATDTADDALDAARALAERTGGTVAVSGPVDLIVDATRTARIHGGSALLTKVTGGGCALGAAMAAFAAVVEPFDAAVAASAVWAVASERAASGARGPGSFAVAFLDELTALRPSDLDGRAEATA